MPATRSRRSSSRVITYVVVKDFNLGIQAVADKVQLPLGATPMARNVEWREKGGFYVRKGVGRLVHGGIGQEMDAPGGIPIAFYHYVRDPTSTTAFTSQYLVATDDGRVRIGVDYGPLVTGTAGSWSTMTRGGTALSLIGRPTFAAWSTNLYISVGEVETSGSGLSMTRWDGATGTALGKAYTNDYAAPTGGNMPIARYITAWSERFWLGCTYDGASGALEPSRIRWSHPGRAEDYAEGDYIDVGQQGDVITGIAPMRDMLLVFKRSSTYALLGSGASNFRVVEVSGTIGCTGEWSRDNQGSIVFWDGTIGLCRFDGKSVVNLFDPLLGFLHPGPAASITRCGGVATDGEKIYVATDFHDYYGPNVPAPLTGKNRPPQSGVRIGPLVPGQTTWADVAAAPADWSALASIPWLRTSVEFYNIVWVYRPGAGWTSFTLNHPDALDVTCLGMIRSRMAPTGDVESSRRIVYGLGDAATPMYLSDRYDNGRDWWAQDEQEPIDSFYMTPWLHGGLPAQVKRFKAPRVIQEADEIGNLLIDVFYDFNYDFLRRTLKVGVAAPLSFDSYSVGKPGTCGRAKAVMLVVRPEHPRHWGVSSITIPVHPKVLR